MSNVKYEFSQGVSGDTTEVGHIAADRAGRTCVECVEFAARRCSCPLTNTFNGYSYGRLRVSPSEQACIFFYQEKVGTMETIEPAAIMEFWRMWDSGKFANQRLGQAFYDHFNLGKMADQSIVGPVYNLDAEAAYAFIRNVQFGTGTLTANA